MLLSDHIVRYALGGSIHYGVMVGDETIARLAAPPFEGLRRSGEFDLVSHVRILAPVDRPRIFGLGYNYKAHSNEVGKPVPDLPILFMKPCTAVIGPNEAIVYPPDGEIVHFEGELCVVIGQGGRHIPESSALQHVLGYTCGNDVSDRVLQRRESAFGCLFAGKGYDTFAPLGPAIVTGLDPSNLQIVTRLNGEVRQNGNTRDLLFSVPYLIAYLSRHLTLLPGDVIMTGTPAGVGPFQVGDTIEVEIPSIGVLRNAVIAE
jgi:2-keto-4-pentenoate hydratase/2-oxohepta-3-ene-1,7-dioic acid hydratase in catechol pathway